MGNADIKLGGVSLLYFTTALFIVLGFNSKPVFSETTSPWTSATHPSVPRLFKTTSSVDSSTNTSISTTKLSPTRVTTPASVSMTTKSTALRFKPNTTPTSIRSTSSTSFSSTSSPSSSSSAISTSPSVKTSTMTSISSESSTVLNSTQVFTELNTVNSSLPYSTETPDMTTVMNKGSQDGSGFTSAMAVGVFSVVAAILLFSGFLLYHKTKHRKMACTCVSLMTCCERGKRRRRSSTSSQGPLTSLDVERLESDLPIPHQERELFSIGDEDGGDTRQVRRNRPRQRVDDDYFYDEIFERSAFVDETTNRSNKELTVEEDEFDIPDLIFKGSLH